MCNGIDDECDDLIDDDDDGLDLASASTFWEDRHSDGFGPMSDDFIGAVLAGPGDLDGDGFADVLVGSEDADPASETGGVYVYGGVASGALTLEATLVAADEVLGRTVAAPGDVNDDGFADILVSSHSVDPGTTWLLLGPQTGGGVVDVTSGGVADAIFTGVANTDKTGKAIAGVGDYDGDGDLDFLIGAPHDDDGGIDAGVCFLVLGPVTGTYGLASAPLQLHGDSGGAKAGEGVAAAGDVDGDGLADLLIGGPKSDTNGSDSGSVWVVVGGLSGAITLPGAGDTVAGAHLLAGESGGNQAGYALAGAGDVNGDGFDDIIIGVKKAGGHTIGSAYLFTGPVTGTTLADAQARVDGDANNDALGAAVDGAGDPNSDGKADVLIGVEGEDLTGASNAGVALLFNGPMSGTLTPADADATFQGGGADDDAGAGVLGPGDVNGDGYDDVIVGAPGADTASDDNEGALYLLTGGGI